MPTGVNQVELFAYGGGTLVDEARGGSDSTHLVLLHGWGANRDSLRAIGSLFEQSHRVHLLDLPGFGAAPPPPATWDTANYADLVQRYLQERAPGPAVLVGHSFGGRVAVRLAARRLPQIRAVVLMGVPGLPAGGFSRARLRRAFVRGLRRTLQILRPIAGPAPLEWHSRTFGSRDYLAAGVLRPLLVRVVNEDLTASARDIECPVLLLWGDEDRETPLWLAHRYGQLTSGRAALHVLPHKGHDLHAGTGAHLCAFKIRSWLTAHAD